jgi:two-component system, LytTR family, response regulator
MIKTFIVEDEQKSLSALNTLIKNYASEMDVCGSTGYVNKAVELIEANKPDLVFMDVLIADGTSFEILNNLSSRHFELIFVTAYENYALNAFRAAAIDYLLKPIGIPEFQEAVERARRKLAEKNRSSQIDYLLQSLATPSDQEKKIKISTLHGYEFVDVSQILWCKSDGHYTSFYLQNKSKLLSSKNLGYYEALLTNYNFFRINHGIVINMHFIKSYLKGKGGSVVMQDGTELEISQRRKSEFLKKLAL